MRAELSKCVVDRAGMAPDAVQNLVLGNVTHSEPRDAYAARIAAIGAGIPQETPAHTVNRLCGSSLQAIIEAAQSIMLGDAEIAIGAGAEIMSRAPYFVPAARWGHKMGEAVMQGGLTGALTDPFHSIHLGKSEERRVGKECYS